MTKRLGNARDELTRRRTALAAVPDETTPVPPAGDATASPEPVPNTGLLAEITRHPLNPRGEVAVEDDALDELANSIKELGILEPLLVASRQAFLAARPNLAEQIPESARWVLIAGERRLVAAQSVGLRSVPITSGDTYMAAGTDVEAMVAENVQRESLTPIQEARAYQALTDAGQSQRNIARRVGRNQSHIARRLRLLKLPTVALDQVDAGTLPIKEAEILTDIAADLVPAVWAEFTSSSYTTVRDALSRVQRQQRVEKATEASKKQVAAEGLDLIDADRLRRAAQLIEDDEIEDARAAGTLAAHVDRVGDLIYLNTKKLAGGEDDHQVHDYEAERRQKDAARRAAMKARRDVAGPLAATAPKAVALTDALVDYVLNRASFDEAKLAAKWLEPQACDPHTWKRDLAGKPAGERRRAAWAITLAAREMAVSSEYSRLDDDGAAYLAELAAAGYQITDHDQGRLGEHAADAVANDDTEEDDTDD